MSLDESLLTVDDYISYEKRNRKIDFRNFAANFSVGTAAGFFLEKNNIPFEGMEHYVSYILPIAINSTEYIINRHIKKYALDTIGDYAWRVIPDSFGFWLGDKFGRYLSKI
jgi:hypothetical protein